MKNLDNLAWFKINGKSVVLVGAHYNGAPSIYCEYDLLICDENKYNKYKDKLIPKNFNGRVVFL